MKIHGNKTVYIIEPLEHGNGGCYGQEILGKMPYREAVKINPYVKYDIYISGYENFSIRICSTDDMNDVIKIWNIEDSYWENYK